MGASTLISVFGLATAAVNLVRTIYGRITRPSARQLAEKAAHDARAASALGNAQAVNARIERERVRRALGIVIGCGILCSGCVPLPVPVVRGSGGDGWSGWRVGLSWGAEPAVIEIPEESAAGGGAAACSAGSCSEGGGR